MIRLFARLPKLWLLLGLTALSLWCAVEITSEIMDLQEGDQELRVVDEAVLAYFAAWRSDTLTIWALNLTALGSTPVLSVLSIFFVILFWLGRDKASALHLAVASTGAGILTSLLKGIFERARPDLVERLAEETSFSYPSGHALSSTAIYFTLSLIFARLLRSGVEKSYVYVAGFFLISVIGLSRVYLAVHYPSDIAGGMAIGLTWALGLAIGLRLILAGLGISRTFEN